MRNKFLGKALMVCLLLTLFSCMDNTSVSQSTDCIPVTSTYREKTISLSVNVKLHEIITPKDTFLVFSKYRTGMVLLKQSPVK